MQSSKPTRVYRCNPHLIAQAVTNLLDNAIKYTPRPGRVSLVVQGDDEHFSIRVTDTGPGIPEHERERVFKRFVRLENERNSPGNGLGLSLVKAVARLHHATLELEDAEPGLCVTMRFSRRRTVEREKRTSEAVWKRAPCRARNATRRPDRPLERCLGRRLAPASTVAPIGSISEAAPSRRASTAPPRSIPPGPGACPSR